MGKKRKKSGNYRQRRRESTRVRQRGFTEISDLLADPLNLINVLRTPNPLFSEESVKKVQKINDENRRKDQEFYKKWKQAYERQMFFKEPIKISERNDALKEIERRRVERICRERKRRREALFLRGKAGRGKPGPKRKRYTDDSDVRC